eukprot:8679699-Prorocentrum_lima.AAC.1
MDQEHESCRTWLKRANKWRRIKRRSTKLAITQNRGWHLQICRKEHQTHGIMLTRSPQYIS